MDGTLKNGGAAVNPANNTLALDHNPQLRLWQRPQPNSVAGKGAVQMPGHSPNLVWQNRATPPTAYENALGDALEQLFESDATTLAEVVAALNSQNLRLPDGQPWTEARYEAEMARLGA